MKCYQLNTDYIRVYTVVYNICSIDRNVRHHNSNSFVL